MNNGARQINIRTGGEFEILDFDQSLANMSKEEFHDVVNWLLSVSDSSCIASFGGQVEQGEVGVILFCGFLERFRTISVLRHLDVSCLVVQDPVAPWFTGSERCPAIGEVKLIAERRFPWVRRWMLVGQSSGGYAALSMSRLMDRSFTLALAPQTFDDSALKSRSIRFPPTFKVSRTMNVGSKIADLREVFFRNPSVSNSRAYIVSAISEHQNPPTEWLWIDAMHWGRLIDHPDITVFVTAGSSHPILLQNVELYAQLLSHVAHQPNWEPVRTSEIIRSALYVPGFLPDEATSKFV